MILKLSAQDPSRKALLGSTLGQQHMSCVYEAVASNSFPPGTLIILDFSGIEAVNGSYIKATAYWLFICGQMSAKPDSFIAPPRESAAVRPVDVFFAIACASPQIEIEVVDFFQPRMSPCVLATKFGQHEIEAGKVLGHVDPALRFTLNAVVARGSGTAPQLHEAYPDQGITVTAWNNRLNDLHALRLLRRLKKGRAWEYVSLAKKLLWE